jgi:hypothetical protein
MKGTALPGSPRRRRPSAMKRVFTARVCKEGDWYVAQALEVDVASQGESIDDALDNLCEALELHFEPPVPTSASC